MAIEDNNGQPPTPPNNGTPPAEGGERMVPQSEVNRIIAERLTRDRAERRTEARAAEQPTEPRPPEPSPPSTGTVDPIDLQASLRFTRAIISMGLPEAQVDVLEQMWLTQRPEGPITDWVRKTLGVFGSPNPSVAHVPAAPALAPVAQGAPAASDPSAYGALDNPLLWTKDQINRICAEKGVAAGRKYIRQRTEEYLSTRRVVRG